MLSDATTFETAVNRVKCKKSNNPFCGTFLCCEGEKKEVKKCICALFFSVFAFCEVCVLLGWVCNDLTVRCGTDRQTFKSPVPGKKSPNLWKDTVITENANSHSPNTHTHNTYTYTHKHAPIHTHPIHTHPTHTHTPNTHTHAQHTHTRFQSNSAHCRHEGFHSTAHASVSPRSVVKKASSTPSPWWMSMSM